MLKINRQLLQATLNYLAKQPFEEVWEIINGLQKCEMIEENKEENTKDK